MQAIAKGPWFQFVVNVVDVGNGDGCSCGWVWVVVEEVVLIDQSVSVCGKGGEKGGDASVEKGGNADHGLPCGSAQQPLEAPAGLRLWLSLWCSFKTERNINNNT